MMIPAVVGGLFGGRRLTAEAKAWADATSTSYGDPLLAVVNRHIIEPAKASGLWDALGVLWLHGVDTSTQSLTNLKSPSTFLLTSTGAGMVFTARQGYLGNGVDYLTHAAAWSTVPGYSLDSSSMFVYSRTDLQASNSRDIGSATSSTSHVIGRDTGVLSCRSNSSGNATATVSDSLGLYGWSRRASNATDVFRGGSILATGTTASTAIGTGNITIGQSGGFHGQRQLMLSGGGNQLSAALVASLGSVSANYAAAIGA